MSYPNLPGAWESPDYPPGQYFGYRRDAPAVRYGVVPGAVVPEYGSCQSRPAAYRGWIVAAGLGGVLFSTLIGMPMALWALRSSRRVQRRWSAGDYQGAGKASRSARTWAIAAAGFDILGLILIALSARAGHLAS